MHSLIEHYLTEVAAQLRSLPVARRNEELREMRQHLLSTVEAHQELGATEQEAVEATLHKFGSSSEAASGLTRVWRRGQGSWLDVAKGGLLGATALWGVYATVYDVLGHYLEGNPHALPALRPFCDILGYALLFLLSGLLGSQLRGRVSLKGICWGAGLGYVSPMVIETVISSWKDSDVLGVSLIVLGQAACLVGAAWAVGRRRLRPVLLARH